MQMEIDKTFKMQRNFFDSGATKNYMFRINNLKLLKKAIKENEQEVVQALYDDLHKPEFESFTSEIGVLYEEINNAISNLKSWMMPQKVSTPVSLQPSTSLIYPQPLGVILIIGPWNYPFQLLMTPLIGAIAAGNCAMIKPSNQAKNTSNLVAKIIKSTFPPEYVFVIQGPGAMVGPMLIEKHQFNHIFFTGSVNVGKQIMKMAATHLTPVTLELGGKSPAIVHKDANLDISAKRLVWAKFFNAGQTCISPDYLLVHKDVKDKFVEKMKKYIIQFFGTNPSQSESYARIINEKRFKVLYQYLNQGNIIIGGQNNIRDKFIAPTLIDNVSLDDSIMKEEIFGPILPILTYNNIKEATGIIRKNRYPLSLYIYSNNEKIQNFFINAIEFGGGCVNNSLLHFLNLNLPFGGVGNSGIGSYHGQNSFDVFSHKKGVVKSSPTLDVPVKYPPYSDLKLKIVKRLMK